MLVCITHLKLTPFMHVFSLGSHDVKLGASVAATPWQAANKVTLLPSWLIVDVCDSTSYVKSTFCVCIVSVVVLMVANVCGCLQKLRGVALVQFR